MLSGSAPPSATAYTSNYFVFARNAKRRAMVENKKKRDAGKVKRRKQVKKIMKDVDKQRAGAALQALPKAKKKKKKKNKNKITPFDPFTGGAY
eukprot:SAG22_NODE_1157_length_5331_cov_1.886086_9_plen_93_part_00